MQLMVMGHATTCLRKFGCNDVIRSFAEFQSERFVTVSPYGVAALTARSPKDEYG